ncbi:MAG: ribonuclease J [Deltaproteobacteria bacterium]
MSYTRIVPLGGLGEIGMNCMALETPQGILVVDCGIAFPHDEPGVDVIHPDFRYLWERREEVLGVVITHGHEDHIGGLPYLLRRLPVPVWAPGYAAALIKTRLAEHREVPVPDLRVTVPRGRFKVGPFEIEPLRVTHSIPDSMALAIDTPGGRIFHTGDFKLESAPMDNQESDEPRFRELGNEGVDLMLSDSTNVDVPGRAARERDVADALRQMIRPCEGRVLVAVFASNIFRLQTLCDVAVATGRRIAFIGRSVENHVRAATDLRLLRVHSDLVISADMALSLRPRELLAVMGGTQAEPGSGLARISRGEYTRLVIERGDTVIFSSRAIPGNERAVFQLVCDLERRGADVHFRATDRDIHASGHAGREEQRQMLDLIRPRAFVPVHGTYHHLKGHAEVAREAGVRVVDVIENGQSVALRGGAMRRDENVPAGRVYVDERVDLDEETLTERTQLAEGGVVFATMQLDARGGLVGTPVVTTRGVVVDDPDAVGESVAAEAIREALRLARGPMERLEDPNAIEAARAALRRVYRVGAKRPMVVVHIRRV